jgi:hypothetical protein
MMQQRADLSRAALPWVLALVVGGFASSIALGQELAPAPPKQRGGFFVPMLTLAETFDDNLFFTQFPEGDSISRVTGSLRTGYRSTPFTIDIEGSRSADFFANHKEFDTKNARTVAQATINYLPVKSLTFSVFACYLDTKTPSELNLATGLSVGRSLATRGSATPVLEYRHGTLSTFTAAYPIAHDTLDGRTADTETALIGFDRRVSRRDTVGLRFEHRWFDFRGGDKAEKSTADVVTLGWVGEIGDRSLFLLRAGPRYGKGELTAEVLATLKHRLKHGLATLTYSKTQATTLGKTGALDVQAIVGTLSTRVSRNLEIASGPGIYRNTLRGKHLMALRLNLEALLRLSSWFHLGATYSFDLQQPDFGGPGHIRRSSLQVKLLTSPRQKVPDIPTDDEVRPEVE